MKRYEIPNAAKLKEAIPLMKDPVEAHKAQSVATVWSIVERQGSNKRFHVFIDLGRKACLHRKVGNDLIMLGEMRLGKTREFVKGLEESED